MTIKDLAHFLQCHQSTIYRLLRKRAIPGFKIGSDWRFYRDTIEDWIRRQPQAIVEERKGGRA